ncbi:MAG TPA: magnesium/cobalt transporter CorA [Chitinophagaceae bacterium]|nr:magnesium/cobalt transporter CorA [Chitinophagaceae bacterium]
MRPQKYLSLLLPIFNVQRTKELLSVNPVAPVEREEAREVQVAVFHFNATQFKEEKFSSIPECLVNSNDENLIHWINVDGLRKKDVEIICNHFGIHYLLMEDILSIDQRPKMDEIESILYGLLNMLYFNAKHNQVEQEQISIVLGKNFVISFQEDPQRDVFNPLREKLRLSASRVRQRGADYLCYSMIDLIVDNYFSVMEKLGERIEQLEEEVIRFSNKRSLAKVNQLRKELIVLKRNMAPVRDLVNGFIRSESDLIEDGTTKYFKDIYDHIVQANDLSDNYRDMMINLQDLYLNNVNLKLNEVMKVMTIVTCLLAPAAVIGGIFGMNFDRIPYLHNQYGFYIAVGLMLLIPLLMIFIFKRRGWF